MIYYEFLLVFLKFYCCFEDLLLLFWFWFCVIERECILYIVKFGMDVLRLVNFNVFFYFIFILYFYMGLGEVYLYYMMVIDLYEN